VSFLYCSFLFCCPLFVVVLLVGVGCYSPEVLSLKNKYPPFVAELLALTCQMRTWYTSRHGIFVCGLSNEFSAVMR
jgi:hypothetical protein